MNKYTCSPEINPEFQHFRAGLMGYSFPQIALEPEYLNRLYIASIGKMLRRYK
ncbi:MAG: hypothetical protein HQK65_02375 [Desulfamplus sp.]|nr:hypothetical protein [Desulfamplus sp.]